MNERIRAREVRLIGADGKQIGVVLTPEALRQARVAGLDLVEVESDAVPPVCRLLDYGKFQYDQDKKERESKKKQKKMDVKGVRISFKMGEHDRALRRSLAEKFLAEGHKVRVEMVLRGREKGLRTRGAEILQTFLDKLADRSSVVEPISWAPRGFTATIAAK